MTVRYLTVEEVVVIHERVLARFGGEDSYPELFAKATALGHSFVLNHPPFVDGNKRTAWESVKRFLAENGYRLRAAGDEIVVLMLRIEDKTLGVAQIADWLRERTNGRSG